MKAWYLLTATGLDPDPRSQIQDLMPDHCAHGLLPIATKVGDKHDHILLYYSYYVYLYYSAHFRVLKVICPFLFFI